MVLGQARFAGTLTNLETAVPAVYPAGTAGSRPAPGKRF